MIAAASYRDEDVEKFLGSLLRTGVLAAAAVVIIGAVFYLARHGAEPRDNRVFHGEPAPLRSLSGIIQTASGLSGRGIIQFGLLLLIATPIARVLFSVYAFARERDRQYVLITLTVLALLLLSLFGIVK